MVEEGILGQKHRQADKIYEEPGGVKYLTEGINKLMTVTSVHCTRYEIPRAIFRPYTVDPYSRTKDVQQAAARRQLSSMSRAKHMCGERRASARIFPPWKPVRQRSGTHARRLQDRFWRGKKLARKRIAHRTCVRLFKVHAGSASLPAPTGMTAVAAAWALAETAALAFGALWVRIGTRLGWLLRLL